MHSKPSKESQHLLIKLERLRVLVVQPDATETSFKTVTKKVPGDQTGRINSRKGCDWIWQLHALHSDENSWSLIG